MRLTATVCFMVLLGAAAPAFPQCITEVEGGDVVTHWSNATNSFSVGATDQFPFAPSADGSSPMWTWGPNLLPDYEDYLADNYSRTAISHAEALSRMQAFSNDVLVAFGNNVPFKLYNPAIGNAQARLLSNPGCVQVIHGLVIDNSVATVMLPPNWSAAAPSGTYPIVVNPFYDVNDNVFRDFGLARTMALWIAESGLSGQTGAIGVVWNGGASISGTTTNEYARHQFFSVIDTVATLAGGDRHRVLVGGGSRGGTATLMLASNPDGYNYRVTFALATGPGTKIGTHVNLSTATIPGQMGLVAPGFANAWLPGWTYPPYGRPSMIGMTGQQALLRLISGNPDANFVDADRSPISDRFVNGLRNAGTQVLLSFGSHDEYIPFGTEVEYLFKLRGSGVPVEAHIVMRGGHGHHPDMYTRLRWALTSYFRPGADPALRTVEAGLGSIRYYAVNPATGGADLFGYSNIQVPFTLEVPRWVYVGMPIGVLVTGEPGTEFLISTNQSPTPYHEVIGPNYQWNITVPAVSAGVIEYTQVQIRKPGSPNWVTLDVTRVPGASPMALNTHVFAGPIPNVSGSTIWSAIRSPCSFGILPCMSRVPAYPHVNWGISEY